MGESVYENIFFAKQVFNEKTKYQKCKNITAINLSIAQKKGTLLKIPLILS